MDTVKSGRGFRSHSGFQVRAPAALEARARSPVLVVDDEPLVLSFVTKVLSSEGYDVVRAPDAETALQLLASGREFSLLLSDVGLPGLLGPDLLRRAAKIAPAMPVLLMSADSKDCLVRKGLLGKADELLVKPFTVPTLLAKLEQVLETASHTLQARGGAVR